MRIGSVELDNFTVFAPLAGITNLPIRLLAKSHRCGLVYSEMISANGLVHNSSKTVKLMDSVYSEKPLSVQIFGAEPHIMSDAAQIVESSNADIVDINFGCSVKKILKTGSGSALMKNYNKAEKILKKVRKSIKIPLSIKIRSGWDLSGKQAIYIARLAQDCGVDAIAVHPRTALQGFGGTSDWSIIRAVKKVVKIPVIGNGDINTPHDAMRMKKETNCDFIMVGRSAIGNPFIFDQVIELNKGNIPRQPTVVERIELMTKYIRNLVKYLGEIPACYIMRSRLCWFVKNMKNATQFRILASSISSQNEAESLIGKYRECLLLDEHERKNNTFFFKC